MTPLSHRTVVVAALLALLVLSASRHLAPIHAAQRAVVAEDTPIHTQAGAVSGATPVLVELFTSEGCSSCPPADTLLARLQHDQPVRGAEVIALEEHVDYWDSLGWHDRFSAHQFTERQAAYAQRLKLDENYTPQMIVNGTDQFVGNDSAHALRAIAQAARTPAKLDLAITSLVLNGQSVAGTVSIAPPPSSTPAGIYAALIEQMASTQVARGENSGRTLHHISVVRDLQQIGDLTRPTPLSFSLPIPKDTAPNNLRVIVFVQRSGQGPVLGATTADLLATAAPTTSNAH